MMMNHRPAGFSDSEDSDEFELSSNYDRDYRWVHREEIPETDESIFYTAVKDGDIETMRTMLDKSFAVDSPLSGGWSALMHASSLGSRPLMELLITRGANVNFNKDLFTSLMALCKCTSSDEEELLKCMDLLLEHGANPKATDRNASTALMFAVSGRHPRLVMRLVVTGVDMNVQDIEGWSALFHAVNDGLEDVVKILLEGRARVDLIDKRKRSAYEIAMQRGFDDLALLVCSKKERRRILQNENELDKFPVPAKLKDPVEELFALLPAESAKSSSGFSSDVGKILWSIGLGNFTGKFATQKVQLNEFLLITDERLKELGVRFSVHRQRILSSVRTFHLHRWNKASLGMKARTERLTVEDGVRLMCNIVKHLHVISATLNYARIHQPVPIKPETFKMCQASIHQLNLINGELIAIQRFATNLERKEPVEPVDLLKPRRRSNRYFVPICAATILVGFVLWKKNVSVSFAQLKIFTFPT